jgi:release factor glutamine methyltransferase
VREEIAITHPPGFEPAMARGAARRSLARALAKGGIESAQIDARVLLCAALGIDHADLVSNPDCPLGPGAAAVATFAARRLQGEPVSRITGRREFWRACFKIGPAVLDPRPATETLIEAVLDHAAQFPPENWQILDLGTGSGVILCSLLQSLPGASGVGTDISLGACAIARNNLATLGLARRGLVVCGDWTHALLGPFDVIVSNPPYVARGEIARLAPEVRDHDPRLALDGGEDGLAAYREIIPACRDLLAPGGLIALEVGAGQHPAVESLLTGAFDAQVKVRLDLDGSRRVVLACPGQRALA